MNENRSIRSSILRTMSSRVTGFFSQALNAASPLGVMAKTRRLRRLVDSSTVPRASPLASSLARAG